MPETVEQPQPRESSAVLKDLRCSSGLACLRDVGHACGDDNFPIRALRKVACTLLRPLRGISVYSTLVSTFGRPESE